MKEHTAKDNNEIGERKDDYGMSINVLRKGYEE